MQYPNELRKLKAHMSSDLWEVLAENGCMIAGGAVTSVFTNKEINDVDVYFPSAEAFTKVVAEVYGTYTHGLESEFGLGYTEARGMHVTKKSLLILSDSYDVQFIGYSFYPTAPDIFKAFDYTINMGACYMYDGRFSLHEDFLKHNAQRYLHFNPDTLYPLISVLRSSKYRERGYTISKAQMLRALLAVNKKNIDSWEKLIDELGGMYGVAPEEIFDTTKEFSLELAIATLDNFEIRDKIITNNPTVDDVVLAMPGSFTQEFVQKRHAYFDKHKWQTNPYKPKEPKQGNDFVFE